MRLHHRYLAPTDPLRQAVRDSIGYCERCAQHCDGGADWSGYSCGCCAGLNTGPNGEDYIPAVLMPGEITTAIADRQETP